MKARNQRRALDEPFHTQDMLWLAYLEACSLQEKHRLLVQRGDFVLDIRYYRYKISLYLFYGHYVEVFYEPKAGRIQKVALLDDKHLSFYADQVKLPAACYG